MNAEEIKKVEKTKKIINTVITVVFAVFMVLILVFVIVQLQMKKNVENGLPNAFGVSFVRVESDSMASQYAKDLNEKNNTSEYGKGFDKGDIIVVKALKNEEAVKAYGLKVGDIITYRGFIEQDGTLIASFITHRIIGIDAENNAVFTQGDKQMSLNVVDQAPDKVYFSEVAGVYKSGIRFKGLADFMDSKWVFFVFIIVPLLLFLMFEIFSFIKALKNYRNEQKQLEATPTLEEAEKTSADLEAQLAALQAQLAAKKAE
ncbi:MAG: S26 family signal peptidase, partial [Bacilli bacterium]|nr:S26 family signal peptidase [Bacilli bacterium]